MGAIIKESRAISLMREYVRDNFPTLLEPFRTITNLLPFFLCYRKEVFRDKSFIVWITKVNDDDVGSGTKYTVNNRLESMYDLFGEELFEMFFLEVHGIDLKNKGVKNWEWDWDFHLKI